MDQPEIIDSESKKSKNKKDHDYNTWSCCCITIDKQMTLFITQLLFSILILLFAMFKADETEGCYYKGLITTILAYWMPSPKTH